MNRVGAPMTRAGIALFGLLLSTTGCDVILAPPETHRADIQLQMVPEESLHAVLGQADRVFLEFRRGETATDTVVPIYFDGSTIRARLRMAPPPGDGDVRIAAELRPKCAAPAGSIGPLTWSPRHTIASTPCRSISSSTASSAGTLP